MAFIAACTDKGAKRSVNQDACCVQVAQTAFGEIVMAIVCDGVGGLAAGELASATVTYRFAKWFRDEFPALLAGMNPSAPLDFDVIQTVWGVLLRSLNEIIQTHGRLHAAMLGTTFSGILICGGSYLVGHVGDCRVYQLGPRGQKQITEDQTLLAKKLASGEVTSQDARSFKQGHIILQSVGTEALLKPVFYKGTCAQTDLFVLCCDGAYRKAEDEGIYNFFAGIDYTNEEALQKACQNILKYDLEHGEKDNLTVVCVSPGVDAGGSPDAARGVQVQQADIDLNQYAPVDQSDDYGPITMLQGEGDSDSDDLPTMVEPQGEAGEDDLPTMAESQDQEVGEEDLPTLAESAQNSGAEEDLPTLVEGDES